MVHAERPTKGSTVYGCCGPIMGHAPRYCGMGFGIMLILAGTLWLATRAGWFDPELFWPIALLVAGFAIIALTLARGRKIRTNRSQNLRKE
jgi:hypothetical protein